MSNSFFNNVENTVKSVIEAPINITSSITKPIFEPIYNDQSDWKLQSFVWIAFIVFLILFIWALVTYDPDQRIFTLYTIPENGTYNFPRFSGQIIIQDKTDGGVTEWLVGGGAVKLVDCSAGCSDEMDPSSGILTYNSSINGYTWTQTKYSAPSTYTFITNRIVKSG